jgi:hypothetical protein
MRNFDRVLLLLLLCTTIDYIDAMQLYTQMMNIRTRPTKLLSMSFKIPEDSSNENPSYLHLDNGMRISRIITAKTTSFDAKLKLGLAKTRLEIMKICLVRHKKTCVLSEHTHIPIRGTRRGWAHHHRHGSPMLTNSGTPADIWVVALNDATQLSIGSWLLATMPVTEHHNTALFSRTISRAYTDAQPVSLIRPGFSNADLVYGTEDDPHWLMTYVELQHSNELGIPTRRR